MIAAMPTSNIISLDMRILDLPAKGIHGLGTLTARKLALGRQMFLFLKFFILNFYSQSFGNLRMQRDIAVTR